MWLCVDVALWPYGFMAMLLWLCGCVAMRLRGSVAMWLCCDAATWLCGYVAMSEKSWCFSWRDYKRKRSRSSHMFIFVDSNILQWRDFWLQHFQQEFWFVRCHFTIPASSFPGCFTNDIIFGQCTHIVIPFLEIKKRTNVSVTPESKRSLCYLSTNVMRKTETDVSNWSNL